MRNIFCPSQTMKQSLLDEGLILFLSEMLIKKLGVRDRMEHGTNLLTLLLVVERANFMFYLCRLKCSLKFINYFLQRIPLKSVNKSVP